MISDHYIIGNNQIGDKGAEFIAAALKENKTLTTLYICNNTRYIKNIQLISDYYIIAYNQIGDKGAEFIAAALKENKTLTELRIGNNTQYIKNIQIDF